MLSLETQQKLRKLFYGQNSFRDLTVLRKKASGVPYDDIKAWYDSQEVVQLMKPRPVFAKIHKPIIAWKPFERFYMDTMFIQNIGLDKEGKKKKTSSKKKPMGLTIVCGLDLFSRYAFAHCIFGEIGISSLQAKDALMRFIKEIKDLGYSIETLYTDSGVEFKQSFKSFVDKEGIPLIMSSPNDPFKNRNIERFNRTLRGLIEKFILLYGKNITSRHIDMIVKTYNNTIHRSLIGFTPYSVLTDKSKTEELWKHYIELKSYTQDLQEPVILQEGTFVRVFIRKADVFKKIGKNWSRTIYTVDKYLPEVKLYKLKEKKDLYRREYLQVVNKELFDKYNYKPASITSADEIVLEGEKRGRRKKVITDL